MRAPSSCRLAQADLRRRHEPLEARIQPREKRNAVQHALDGGSACTTLVVPLPVVDLLLGRVCVVRPAGVMHPQVRQHGRAEAELADVADVRLVLEPEDLLLVLAEAADALVELTRGDRAAAAGRATEQPNAVLLDERVLVRADVVPVARREVVGIVLEVRGEEADLRQALERVEERRVPAGRSARPRRRRARSSTALS